MDNNIIKFIQQQQHNSNSTDDNDYATTKRRTTTMQQCTCMWYHLMCLNEKAFQGMSPQQFEGLKHSQGMSPQQLNDKVFQGISPQQWMMNILGHEPSTRYEYEIDSNCVYLHTTQQQRRQLLTCIINYDILPNLVKCYSTIHTAKFINITQFS